jgi:hypothetical protein
MERSQAHQKSFVPARDGPSVMGFSIEHFGRGVLGTVFFDGTIDPQQRLAAFDALDRALEASGATGLLVDLSQAALGRHGAGDALELAERVMGMKRPPPRVAYVMQPYQTDIVATVMAGVHGPSTFRRFEAREAALSWLGQAGAT